MGRFTRFLVISVTSLFLVAALLSATAGSFKAAVGCIIIGTAVAFIGFVGWLAGKYPLPPLPPGAPTPNLSSELARFRAHYPGIPGRVVTGSILIMFLIVLLLRGAEILR